MMHTISTCAGAGTTTVLHPMSYVVVGGMGVAMHGVAVYAHVYMGYEYML